MRLKVGGQLADLVSRLHAICSSRWRPRSSAPAGELLTGFVMRREKA